MAPPQFWWLQPLIVTIGVVVAVAAIVWNRRVARFKATLDLIEGSESKEFYQVRYRAYRRYRQGGEFRDGVLDPSSEEGQTNRDYCMDFLNHYELVAIACQKGIIDEKFYRLWMGPTLVRDWNCATDLVRAARSPRRPGDPGGRTAFSEFEALAVKWGGTPLT